MMGCQKTATPLFDPQNTVPSVPFVCHLCAISVITCHHLDGVRLRLGGNASDLLRPKQLYLEIPGAGDT